MIFCARFILFTYNKMYILFIFVPQDFLKCYPLLSLELYFVALKSYILFYVKF